MKYLTEFRDREKVEDHLQELNRIITRPWTLMEICGGQTHSLVKNGLLNLLPKSVTMVHGPGCPVCVTPVSLIDQAIELAEKGVILCSFGDMLRVPGSEKSLLQVKAEGSDVRIVYSPLEALKVAQSNPEEEIVFFAVGFETTAPANALSVVHASKLGLKNFSLLVSHVLVPPALEAILQDEHHQIDAILAAGHVCTIMGGWEYQPLVDHYRVPIVITGFEPVDLIQGILMAVRQLEKGAALLENQYKRVVRENGNASAREIMFQVFEKTDREWRGIGEIKTSGFRLKSAYAQYDATVKFQLLAREGMEDPDCIAGLVLKGIRKPIECTQFGKRCTPESPLGAPMVSSEGACAAYYHYHHAEV